MHTVQTHTHTQQPLVLKDAHGMHLGMLAHIISYTKPHTHIHTNTHTHTFGTRYPCVYADTRTTTLYMHILHPPTHTHTGSNIQKRTQAYSTPETHMYTRVIRNLRAHAHTPKKRTHTCIHTHTHTQTYTKHTHT
eukprot:GDKI01047387.1.p2 GENE.GDKI01047387.1~~GDKI01047387.1.p2  ORF type:complete len:135 (-),score=60.71 GDKI01047387.1:181-585(-)